MSDIALYYPHLLFHDERWLKTALLFWPAIGRVVPEDFSPRDSAAVRVFADHDLVINVRPAALWVQESSQIFFRAFSEKGSDLEQKYRLPRTLTAQPGDIVLESSEPSNTPPYVEIQDPDLRKLGWANIRRINTSLVEELRDRGLAVIVRTTSTGHTWAGMHPELAAIYTCVLAETVARVNGLQAITDDADAHPVLNGWSVETLIDVLLGDSKPTQTLRPEEVAEIFVLTTLQTVVPAGLERMPAERIIALRTELRDELGSFRTFVAGLHDRFDEIGNTADPAIRTHKLDLLTMEEVEPQLRALERSIRRIKLEPVRAIFSMKKIATPAVAEVFAHQIGVPAGAAATATVAVTLLASTKDARAEWHKERATSPVGYLLGLEHGLSPGLVTRTADNLFRRAGRSLPPAGW